MKLKKNAEQGFSVVELLIGMTLMLIMMSAVSVLLARSITTRSRETKRTQALAAAQRSISLMEREIANAGFGLQDNGLILNDSKSNQLHFRGNLNNSNSGTSDKNEDVTYYFDSASQRVMRYEKASGTASVVASGITQMSFSYQDYVTQNNGAVNVLAFANVPTANTAKVRITATVALERFADQPAATVTLVSDVTLRNSNYLIEQY